MKDSIDARLCSTRFNASNIPGIQYCLKLYPNGKDEARRGEVLMVLYVNLGNESKVKVDGKFCIESTFQTTKLNHEYHRAEGCGSSPCETADFFDSKKNYIVDGLFVLKFEGTLSVEKEKTENGNKIKSVTGHLGPLFWMNEDKDFTIHVGESAVKVSFELTVLVCNIYIFRFINQFSLLIPPFSKQCSNLTRKKRKKIK